MSKLTVFQILAQNKDGIPTSLRMIRDDETVNVAGSEELLTGFIRNT